MSHPRFAKIKNNHRHFSRERDRGRPRRNSHFRTARPKVAVFDEVAWQEEIQRQIGEIASGNRVKHFFTYCLYKVKYRFMRNNPEDEYSGGFDDNEIHVRGMCDIYDENRIKFEEFAEEVLDKGIASIEHEGY